MEQHPQSRGRMGIDAGATDPLMAAMAAARNMDLSAYLVHIEQARTFLHQGHGSLPLLERGVQAAQESEWGLAWSQAYQGIVQLVWTFPPDISLCPAPPGEIVPEHCGQQWRGASFCPMCGAALS